MGTALPKVGACTAEIALGFPCPWGFEPRPIQTGEKSVAGGKRTAKPWSGKGQTLPFLAGTMPRTKFLRYKGNLKRFLILGYLL